jgi:hypothetical protein
MDHEEHAGLGFGSLQIVELVLLLKKIMSLSESR